MSDRMIFNLAVKVLGCYFVCVGIASLVNAVWMSFNPMMQNGMGSGMLLNLGGVILEVFLAFLAVLFSSSLTRLAFSHDD